MNQARTTYLGGVSEVDKARHLLHGPDKDLEVQEVRTFVKGACEAPTRPSLTNLVYDGTRTTLLYAIVCNAFPQELARCPVLAAASHMRRAWAHLLPPPLPLNDRGHPQQRTGPLSGAPRHPPPPPHHHNTWGPRGGPWGHPGPTLWAAAEWRQYLAPPTGDRGSGRGTHLPAEPGGERHLWGPLCAALLSGPRRPPRPGGPDNHPRVGFMAHRIGRVARPPPASMTMDNKWPMTPGGHHHSLPAHPWHRIAPVKAHHSPSGEREGRRRAHGLAVQASITAHV